MKIGSFTSTVRLPGLSKKQNLQSPRLPFVLQLTYVPRLLPTKLDEAHNRCSQNCDNVTLVVSEHGPPLTKQSRTFKMVVHDPAAARGSSYMGPSFVLGGFIIALVDGRMTFSV